MEMVNGKYYAVKCGGGDGVGGGLFLFRCSMSPFSFSFHFTFSFCRAECVDAIMGQGFLEDGEGEKRETREGKCNKRGKE